MTIKKIAAFTLMEVTIAMLIAAIAIGITYTAYHIISGTYQNYTKKQESLSAYTAADKLLKTDFMLSKAIVKTTEGLQLEFESGQVIYNFKDGKIVRDQFGLRTDTFDLAVTDVQFQFEKEEAIEADTVDQLSFQSKLEGENIPQVYIKRYSAQQLFK